MTVCTNEKCRHRGFRITECPVCGSRMIEPELRRKNFVHHSKIGVRWKE